MYNYNVCWQCMLLKNGIVTLAKIPRWHNLEVEHKCGHKMSNVRLKDGVKNY